MNDVYDVSRVEKRVFHAYWQDGLLDILAGVSVMAIGLGWLLGVLVAGMGVPIVAIFVWGVLRRRVTEPRLGRVTFSDWRNREMKLGMIAIVSLGIVLFGFVGTRIARGGPPTPLAQWFAPAIPAFLLVLLCLSCAEALRLGRFVIHALAFATSGLIAAAVGIEPGWSLILAGAFVACWGVYMLKRFLRSFPPLPAEPLGDAS
ncbi:MAG: hypothetical protein J5J06_07425 [Phycisphaerae bacterium]|nr:hypothetical protein [Phycisphaerae bacterium]